MNIPDKIVLLITRGIMILLFVTIIGDYAIAVDTGREVSKDIVTLMKMSVTGLIGIIGGYVAGKNARRDD